MVKTIGVRSSAADRFALVASTMIQAEPVNMRVDLLQGIGLEQLYSPEGNLKYTDTDFKTLDDITVFLKVLGTSDWTRKTLSGVHLNLREAAWVGNMPSWTPGIIGNFAQPGGLGSYGIQVWELIRLFVRESAEIPKVISPAISAEKKISFLERIVRLDKGIIGCNLELKYSPTTAPGELSYLQPEKLDEFIQSRGNAELLPCNRPSWRIEGKLIAIVPTYGFGSHRLVIKGSCGGGPGKDIESFMVVPAYCAISGLIFKNE